jgi:membrane protease subunit (stomatin/prohibitin family)
MAIVQVVKYNGGPDTFAWKYPSEELGTWTQLIVNESQEAVLFKGGKALDIFQSGRHTLDTANIPFLNKIINLPFGGRSPFTAEVWFINKIYSLDIKWGTSSPIQIQDPKYGVFVPVRSNGMFGIKIEDSKKFLIKLVGTLSVFDKTSIVKYFRGLYVTKVKDAISSYLIHKQISVLEINAYIDEISNYMKERIEPTLDEYGIKLVNFYVNDISIPEDDPAVAKLKDALAKRAEMNSKNPSSSSAPFMGAGLGLGMGVGLGGAVHSAFSQISTQLNTMDNSTQKECPSCHVQMNSNQRFCGSCGCDTEKKTIDEKNKKSKIICSKCAYELTTKTKFCPDCGKKYNPCPECGADLPEGCTSCDSCGYELPGKCPKCGSPTLKGVKFCPECGESLVHKCPKCNASIEGSPKFCPECGEKLI